MGSAPLLIPSPWGEKAVTDFLEHYFYSVDCFMISSVENADADAKEIRATWAPGTRLLVGQHQRGPESWHPRHVSGADMLMMTVSLGSLHAYFFHGCRWQEGWVGFGNRMEGVEFKSMAKPDAPMVLRSREARTRRGSQRVLLDMEFEFTQQGQTVYSSRQTALFVRKP